MFTEYYYIMDIVLSTPLSTYSVSFLTTPSCEYTSSIYFTEEKTEAEKS